MSSPTEYVVTTTKARENFASALTGTTSLSAITQIAFGNGGFDSGAGEPTQPDPNATSIAGELLKKDIESFNLDVVTTAEFVGILDFDELNGEDISSIGLYNADNELMAIKHTSPKAKTSDTKLEINFENRF